MRETAESIDDVAVFDGVFQFVFVAQIFEQLNGFSLVIPVLTVFERQV